MRHGITSRIDARSACDRRVAVRFFFYLFHGLVPVSHMGKSNGNIDLVCEKSVSSAATPFGVNLHLLIC